MGYLVESMDLWYLQMKLTGRTVENVPTCAITFAQTGVLVDGALLFSKKVYSDSTILSQVLISISSIMSLVY